MASDTSDPLPSDISKPPRHIAVIMDGNGRWAKERGLARHKGHAAGVETVRTVVKACNRWGVEALTLYAFSTENWNRPAIEVNALMHLLGSYLRKEREELHGQNVRILAIGDIAKLPSGARRELDASLSLTEKNTGLKLVLALSYGGRDEVVRAVRKLAEEVKAGRLAPEKIDEAAVAANLDTAGLPDPDMVIRTAGERRLSNFLLWQASYAEYYSTEALWPDFGEAELIEAFREFQRRDRKFGGVKQ